MLPLDESQALQEIKAYVGFDDDVDGARLRALHAHVMSEATAITDRFYDIVLRFEGARRVFADDAQVHRLKGSLERFLDEMLKGPFDLEYYHRRLRIGHVHVRVGLPSRYMFTAMNRLMEDVQRINRRVHHDDVDAMCDTAATLRRVADLELAIMVGTYIEAREQRGLEELRDLLISHLPTTVLLIDREGLVATSTSPWQAIFSGPSRGLPIHQALHPDIVAGAKVLEHLARATSTGREIVVPRVDVNVQGDLRTLRVAFIPVNHALAQAIVHIEDLTETLQSEARAKQAEHLAQLGTMAATVAHEIRNPLAGISGTVQVIANALSVDDPRRRALGKVQEQIQRLGDLVGDLLMFARPINAEVRPVELDVVARAAVAAAAANTGHTAEIVGKGRAVGDHSLLLQILLNLVQNAWQAGAERVVVGIVDGVITVDDNGNGIPEGEREKVFEPFFTTRIRGTGLGLPVARKMVDAMDGTLVLGVADLGGSRFTLRLPTL